MTTERKLTFAPFVAAACALWLVATVTGAQAFTAIIGLLAIVSLLFSRPSYKLEGYGLALVAALVWITVTASWSPASGPIFSGTMTGEDFSIDVASVRLIGVAIFSGLAIGATRKISIGKVEKSTAAILIFSGLLAALIVAVYFFREQILAFAYPGEPEKALNDGNQNVQRAANSVAVFLPIGIAAFASRINSLSLALSATVFVIITFVLILLLGIGSRVALAFPIFTTIIVARFSGNLKQIPYPASQLLAGASIIVSLAVMLIVFQNLGSQSAVLSALVMLAGFAFVWVLPKTGLKALLYSVAGYILFAPLLFLGLTRAASLAAVRLPESFQARLFGWQETISKILERPLTGHGLEASGTWKTTYVVRPEWLDQLTALASEGNSAAMHQAWQNYPIVPGHPHNMALELWAEAGFIGVALVVLALFLVARKTPAAEGRNRVAVFASAGLICAALPLFSFAYSAWNEAYWGMLAIAACAIIVLSKKSPG